MIPCVGRVCIHEFKNEHCLYDPWYFAVLHDKKLKWCWIKNDEVDIFIVKYKIQFIILDKGEIGIFPYRSDDIKTKTFLSLVDISDEEIQWVNMSSLNRSWIDELIE